MKRIMPNWNLISWMIFNNLLYGTPSEVVKGIEQSSTDGMNPFNKNKTSYSMWPITLAMLNLP